MTAARKVPVVLAKFLAHGAVIGQPGAQQLSRPHRILLDRPK